MIPYTTTDLNKSICHAYEGTSPNFKSIYASVCIILHIKLVTILWCIMIYHNQFHIAYHMRYVKYQMTPHISHTMMCKMYHFMSDTTYISYYWGSDNSYIDGLVQDYSISIANALEILQSCIKPSISYYLGSYGPRIVTLCHKDPSTRHTKAEAKSRHGTLSYCQVVFYTLAL